MGWNPIVGRGQVRQPVVEKWRGQDVRLCHDALRECECLYDIRVYH
jgi:hypothetical protein